MKNRQRIKKLEDKVGRKAQRSFCVFQEGESNVIKYNGKEYKDLDTFKVEEGVSELDNILVVQFLSKKDDKQTTN